MYNELTKINFYFLDIVSHMVEMEKTIKENKDDLETLRLAKKYGFSDPTIAALWDEKADQVRDLRKKQNIIPVYKMVDTCAAEFESKHLISIQLMMVKMNHISLERNQLLLLVLAQLELDRELSLIMPQFTVLKHYKKWVMKQL